MRSLAARRQRILRDIEHLIADARTQKDEGASNERALLRARDALAGLTVTRPVSSRRVAGKAAIEAVATVLRDVGRTTQVEIRRATGKNSGTVSHALRVLETEHKARKTGRRAHGSDEWAWVGEGVEEAAA